MGLFNLCQGQYNTFLYTDPNDNAVLGQIIGYGDGVTESFTLMRSIGGGAEPAPGASAMPTVYLNGAVQSGGWP